MKQYLIGIVLLLGSSTVWSASVWAPTNVDVNFINSDLVCYTSGFGCPDAILGIFDDSDTGYGGDYLAISLGMGGDKATFSPTPIGQAINYDLTNATGTTPSTLTLSGNDHFLIALKDPMLTGSWVAPTGESCFVNSTTCRLTWDLGPSSLVVDIEKVVPPEGMVPVPPAVWLFGSGLLGMVGIARRKEAA